MNSIPVNQIFSRPHMNRYRTKSKEVTAIQLKTAMSLNGKNNIRTGQIGDWLVDDGTDQSFLTNEQFLDKYEPAQIAPIIWPKNPFPDTYPGIRDTYPWPMSPQWPQGPIYWSSAPYVTCTTTDFKLMSTGVPLSPMPFCNTLDKCSNGEFHNFVSTFPLGSGSGAVSKCTKCGKTPKELSC